MISSHMLHGVAVCAFRDLRIPSVSRKITEKSCELSMQVIKGELSIWKNAVCKRYISEIY